MQAKVRGIYIPPQTEAPMQSMGEARLQAGRCIVGDRYYLEKGTF